MTLYKRYLFLAVLLHAAIAVGMINTLRHDSAGGAQVAVQAVYIAPSVSHHKEEVQQKGVSVETSHAEPSKRDKYVGKSTLLAILHNAIKSELVYPERAIQLHETGLVTLTLCLKQSDALVSVDIISSSGFNDLDRAAIRAVQAAAPFSLPPSLMQVDACFDVPVAFTLS